MTPSSNTLCATLCFLPRGMFCKPNLNMILVKKQYTQSLFDLDKLSLGGGETGVKSDFGTAQFPAVPFVIHFNETSADRLSNGMRSVE